MGRGTTKIGCLHDESITWVGICFQEHNYTIVNWIEIAQYD